MSAALRVLIVEDSEDDALLLLRELRRGGYEVTSERVDSAATLLAATASREWDLVICDHSMPNFSGTDALRLLRDKGLEAPFIFVSGTIGEDAAVAALKMGAQDYLMKDNLARLLPAIERELNEVKQRRERRHLEQRVQQLQKFEAIGRLAGGIAHDFNNVLGIILGWAQLGFDEAPSDSQFRERFRVIGDQARSAAGLTQQLLAFARRQVLQPKNLDLNDLAKNTTRLLGSVLGANVDFKLSLAPGALVIRADPTQIEQLLMNLCLNARDAMPKGGRLAVTTAVVDIDADFCRVHTYARPGRFVLLSVSDTGTGMDAATLERIFEPFFTTKENGKGTGLGLSTVYGIVKQHGGFVNVYSEPSMGTTFRVYMPAGSGAAEARSPVMDAKVTRGTETVLIAEDHDGLREIATETLKPGGYSVIVARDGEE
ncbi:MAG TPA: ATP-binding protein, partial [Terriglobales bacterium]